MINDDNWAERIVAVAMKDNSLVTAAASSRMAELLRTQLSDKQSTPAELKAIANWLIADMVFQDTQEEL
jgi:hypothetical protein